MDNVTTQEAAELLEVSHPYVLNLINTDMLPHQGEGEELRIPLAAIETFKERHGALHEVAMDAHSRALKLEAAARDE